MEQFYVVITLSILVISTLWYIKTSLNPARKLPPLPPGPWGLPILGYLPFMGKNLLHQFTELANQYGPIYKLHLGSKLYVVISSPFLVKEVVRDQDPIFANRDATVAALVATYGGNDIAWSPHNSQWRTMRKIFSREMLNNNNLEATYNLRKEEVRKSIRIVYCETGKPVHFGEILFRTELNVIMNMLWGGIVEGEEGQRIREEFQTLISKFVDLFGEANISDFFPVLAGLDIQGIKKQTESYVQAMDRVFDAIIAAHKNKLFGEIKTEEKKDFVQILLELTEKNNSEMTISERQVKAMMLDFVVAGTDTSATTVEWTMAELMNNPKVMERVQEELSEVVGMNNIVEEFHMPKLKYLEAVLKETLRLHPALPLLLPRSPSQSSTIGNYTIPKNTRVFINVAWIQRDPSIWDSPLEFKPERFLDDDKKCDFRGNSFDYLPFGSGRRICSGLPLAQRMLMYLLASLVHSFEWKLPDGETLDMSEKFGIVLRKSTPLIAIPSPRLFGSDLYA